LGGLSFDTIEKNIGGRKSGQLVSSSIGGKYSMATISDKQRAAGLNKEASYSISESKHTQSTHSPKMYGTVRLDAGAAEGMAKTNNDFGRGHEALVTG
jgi:hypothetical protein